MLLNRSIFSLLLVLSLLAHVTPALADTHTDIRWDSVSADYAFGGQIKFQARFSTDTPIEEMLVFMQVEGEPATRSGEAALTGPGKAVLVYDLSQQPIRAFSSVTYWFEGTTADGESESSPKQEFFYEDNRFNWQTRTDAPFRVHWYEGDAAFAQSLLDVAEMGLQRVQSYIPAVTPDLVDIYAYASVVEMQGTLLLSGRNWVAGHADPDLGVMVVSLPLRPDQRLEMERQIPHELMHILLYRYMGSSYSNLPLWFSEGLASITELYPNPDYEKVLNIHSETDSLFSMAELCQAFPNDPSGAVLAYAQSTSFTRYLHQQYGASGIQKMIAQYQDGIECDRAVQNALGSSLQRLDKDWRRAKFGRSAAGAAGDLAPWLILLTAIMVVPLGLMIIGLRRRGGRDVRNSSSGTTARPVARNH